MTAGRATAGAAPPLLAPTWTLRARLRGMATDGELTIDVRAPRATIEALVERMRGLSIDVATERLARAPEPRARLTPAQDEAIRLAVTNGYYRIPRSLNLCALAQKGGVSPAAMSERLRRAEARIVVSYVEEMDARTAHPSDASGR